MSIHNGKIIVVGNGGVGKTSLITRLVQHQFDSVSEVTRGINVTGWEVTNNNKEYNLNLWDFGGQEIYHATHQFFFSKRTLYILVWNARTDDDLTSINYWLNLISLFGEDSPIIIVQSKVDEMRKEINKRAISEKFPNIIGYYDVSSLSGEGLENLRDVIIKEVGGLNFTNLEIPQKWLEVKSKLEEISEEKPYIELKEYLSICKTEKIESEEAKYLSQYLTDLGVILHHQNNPILKEILFTNPNWVTNSIYRITDSDIIRGNEGKFQLSDLKTIWGEYPISLHIQLIELGKIYEIFFQLNGKQEYLVPALLPSLPPQFDWNFKDNLVFKFSYEFMPKGILNKFIVRKSELISKGIFWREGVLIESFDSEALVREYPYDNTIEVRVRGENSEKLFSLIQKDFEEIHSQLNQARIQKLIPCICEDCKNSDAPYYFDYAILLKGQEKNIESLQCAKSLNQVSISDLLKGIQEGKNIQPIKIEKLKLTTESISYDWNESDNLKIEIHINNSDNYLFQKIKLSLSHIVTSNLGSNELFIIENTDTQALVINLIEENKLKISVVGYQKDILFGILRYEIEKNAKDLYSYKEVIKCNCNECRKVKPFYFEYQFILKRLKKNKAHVICNTSGEDIEINSLLNQNYEDNEKEEIKHIKFFYSSSAIKSEISQEIIGEIKKVKLSISENNTKTALELLTSIFEKQNNIQGLNACILHSSSLSELQMRKNLNLIDYTQEGLGKSKINSSILDLIQMEFNI